VWLFLGLLLTWNFGQSITLCGVKNLLFAAEFLTEFFLWSKSATGGQLWQYR
jgi:hypothetical protein